MSDKNNTPAAPSIEELQAKNTALEAISIEKNEELNALIKQLDELRAINDALESISLEQAEQIETLKAEIDSLKKSPEAVSSITVQKDPAAKKLIPEKSFKVGGKSFQFVVAQFRRDGVIVKSVDALSNQDLLKEIVEKYPDLVAPVK